MSQAGMRIDQFIHHMTKKDTMLILVPVIVIWALPTRRRVYILQKANKDLIIKLLIIQKLRVLIRTRIRRAYMMLALLLAQDRLIRVIKTWFTPLKIHHCPAQQPWKKASFQGHPIITMQICLIPGYRVLK